MRKAGAEGTGLKNKIGWKGLRLPSLVLMLLLAQQLNRGGRRQWRAVLHMDQGILPLVQRISLLTQSRAEPGGDASHSVTLILCLLLLMCLSYLFLSLSVFFGLHLSSLFIYFFPPTVLEIYEAQPIKTEPSFSSQLWKLYISVSSLLFYGQDQMQKC